MSAKLEALFGFCAIGIACSTLGGAMTSNGAGSPAGVSVHPELWPRLSGADAVPWKDQGMVDRLLASLSLEEKVGQMIQADIASITPADLQAYKLGSILAGGNAAPGGDLRTTPEAWLQMTQDFHRAALAGEGAHHAAIPLLFGIDAVHGHAKVKGATIFPHNVGLGAAHDADLIRRIGAATAEEVAATGIDWTFAPTVAVVRDVRWGRAYESYSESPELVAEYASAMVTGLQGARNTAQFMAPGHTLSSVKHFIGDGGTAGGRDQGDTVVTEATLSRVHGAGYPAAIEAGALIVMASYNSWNGEKLHGDRYLITDILKGRLGFKGFVVGDWNAQEQVPGCTKSSCAAAILAGVDMLMAPDGWQALYENTLAQVRAGIIPQARIDDAVHRILSVKAAAGMFDRAAATLPAAGVSLEVIGSAAHRALAREAVRKSLVLLKNARSVLPLDPRAHLLVAGAAADDVGMQSGGWSIDWQGAHNGKTDFPGATTIYAGIQAAVYAAGGTAVLSRDGRFTHKPDAAIVVFGETPYAEFQGDRETLDYSASDPASLALLRRLKAQGIPTVSVFLSGRPLWVNRELNASDAFVAAWLPGSEGEGIADLLFKVQDGGLARDFTGHLSFSWPATAMPVTFDAADRVSGALFDRGAGLSYADGRAGPVTLSEDARIPAYWRAPAGSLYHARHVTAPWSVFVADADAEVHLTNAGQASPRGTMRAAPDSDGLKVTWTGTGEGMLRIVGRAFDLRPKLRDGSALVVRYRVDRKPEGRVRLGMRCTEPLCGTSSGPTLNATELFASAAVGRWQTLTVPLACFDISRAALADVEVPFAIATEGRFDLTLADVRLAPGKAGPAAHCPPAADR